jgi:hypothetical protein
VLGFDVSVISLDQTRVFVLMSVCVALLAVVTNVKFMPRMSPRIVGVVVFLFLPYPGL